MQEVILKAFFIVDNFLPIIDPYSCTMSSSVVSSEFVHTGYGKNYVKLIQLRRDGPVHYVKEVEVNTQITLNNHRDYLFGDNSDIIATDSQKNTTYILAKQFGIETIEKFGMLMCEHFLNKYRHVVNAKIYIEEAPWRRIEKNGRQHVHAFVMSPESKRFCEVEQKRGEKACVAAGIKDMKILKTTQSAFRNFVDDEYRTLPDVDDRFFSTIVYCRWTYNDVTGLDFDRAWDIVKSAIIDTFAGPPETGVFSPSVQKTLYLAEKNALALIPQVDTIEMTLPNVHYFNIDFKRFPKMEFGGSKQDVYLPTDKPSGNIQATIRRSQTSKL
ncbi:hypothetical protein ScPMuIL_011514 [Solemya velum]